MPDRTDEYNIGLFQYLLKKQKTGSRNYYFGSRHYINAQSPDTAREALTLHAMSF